MLKNKFIKNLAGYSIVSIIGFGLGFVATPIMTRLYAPEALGSISMFQSSLGLLSVIVLVGQDQAYARFYYDSNDKNQLLSINVFTCLISWLITMLATVFFSSYVSLILMGEKNDYAIVMCAACTLPYCLIRMETQIYRIKNNIKGYTVLSIVTNIVTKLGVISIAFFKPSANAWVMAFTILYFILAVITTIICVKKYNIALRAKSCGAEIKELLRFGLPLVASSFTYLLIAWLPKTILTDIKGLYEVGIYAAAISLASAINLVENGLNSYFGIYFYENYKNDDGEVNVIHHGLAFISAIVLIAMLIFSDLIIYFLGEKYTSALTVFPYIVCANIFCALSETTVHGIDIAKKTPIHILISVLSTISGGLVTMILTPGLGAMGAAIGYCVAMLSFMVLRTLFGQHYLRLVKDLWLTIVCCVAMIGVVFINVALANSLISKILIMAVLGVMIVLYCLYFKTKSVILRRLLHK